MDKTKRKFPLVADDAIIVEQPKIMQLYDNEDLINNIHGAYQDKEYKDLLTRTLEKEQLESSEKSVEPNQTYAERMREEAKRDLKQKRQSYLANKVKVSPSLSSKKPKKTVEKEMEKGTSATTELARFSDKLAQDSYILAELPKHYQAPQHQTVSKKTKNNYDFLKKSQIYNYPDNQLKKEHQIAQELNLTRFEELD